MRCDDAGGIFIEEKEFLDSDRTKCYEIFKRHLDAYLKSSLTLLYKLDYVRTFLIIIIIILFSIIFIL